jgi:cytoskeletal protein RodZ
MTTDAKTISITLIVVVIAFVWGLKFIRQFALQIAQENHDAVAAMEQQEEQQRLKKERAADEATAVVFAKVEPLLTTS